MNISPKYPYQSQPVTDDLPMSVYSIWPYSNAIIYAEVSLVFFLQVLQHKASY